LLFWQLFLHRMIRLLLLVMVGAVAEVAKVVIFVRIMVPYGGIEQQVAIRQFLVCMEQKLLLMDVVRMAGFLNTCWSLLTVRRMYVRGQLAEQVLEVTTTHIEASILVEQRRIVLPAAALHFRQPYMMAKTMGGSLLIRRSMQCLRHKKMDTRGIRSVG
jgi:hypothetical protein